MKYTVAKYLRISMEDIDLDESGKYESNSIGNQRDMLDDYISRIPEFEGCEVIEALDDGQTGTNFFRPGVQKLIAMAQSGEVNCIIVKDAYVKLRIKNIFRFCVSHRRSLFPTGR
jgi:DNA invertase Pin-like site-specific DNA recombinase